MSESQRQYLRKLGYTEQRIAALERAESSSKSKASPLAELVYKTVAVGSSSKSNAISELVRQHLIKEQTAASPTASPLVNRLIATQRGA